MHQTPPPPIIRTQQIHTGRQLSNNMLLACDVIEPSFATAAHWCVGVHLCENLKVVLWRLLQEYTTKFFVHISTYIYFKLDF